MKRITQSLAVLGAFLVSFILGDLAWAQISGGPLSGTTSAQVIALWTGTCNSGTFLRGDGACAAASGSGTVTSVTVSSTGTSLTASGTNPITTSGTVNLDITETAATSLASNLTQAANTSLDGLILADSTTAAAASQQYSPRIRLTGQGWKTTATAASEPVDWIIENQPIQGAATPTSKVVFANQINGGGYTNILEINSSGANSTILNGGSSGLTVQNGGVTHITLGSTSTLTGTWNINASNNAVTGIGTGSTTSAVNIGGGSNAVTIAASAGNLTLSNVTTGTNADFMCMAAGNIVTLQSSSCTISSKRFKEHLVDLRTSALPVIGGIEVVSFNMKPREKPNPDRNFGSHQVGLIAENIAQVAPECAIYEDDMKTPKSYRQECVIALLVKATQEQQTEINYLKHQLRSKH